MKKDQRLMAIGHTEKLSVYEVEKAQDSSSIAQTAGSPSLARSLTQFYNNAL
jgi:hypothetical protein